MSRDEFTKKVRNVVALRSAFICSAPQCKRLTVAPCESDESKAVTTYKIAHITGAAENGPRYDNSLTSLERSSIDNALFLCTFCSELIDKNSGIDFSVGLLKEWKKDHENWVLLNLNKKMNMEETIIVEGHHEARGKNNANVTGLKISKGPVIIKPGTTVVAEGDGGTVIGTHIG